MDQQTPGCKPVFRLPGLSALVLMLLTIHMPAPTFGTYYVSLPRAFSPGNPLDLYIQVTDATSPVNVEATIIDANKTAVARAIRTINSGKPEQIRIDVPNQLPSSRYVIAVTGTGGLAFRDEAHLHYEQDVLVLIQTDKARYTAGQTVQYRAVFLRPDLTNYRGNASISIYDGKNNRIKIDGPRQISDGVIEGKLDLSREPVYGEWKIQTNVLDLVENKSFKVFDYVLPRFNVEIMLPNDIVETEQTILVMIKSRYTFNTDVHGSCTLLFYPEGDQNPHFFYQTSKPIHGMVNFTIAMSDLRDKGLLMNDIMKVRATVTDNSTLLSFATEKDLKIHKAGQYKYELKELITRHGFVNGLNHTTYLKLTVDGKPPYTIGWLHIEVTYYSVVLKTCQYVFNHYDYLDITTSIQTITKQYGENGIAEVSFPVTGSDIEKIDISVDYGGARPYKTTLFAMSKTPTDMLRLTLSSAELQVGNVLTVTAESLRPITGPVTIEVSCRNRLVQLNSVVATGQTVVRINVSLSADMVPFSYIVVSHITTDGRVMSDSAYIQVDGSPIKNKVQVTYSTQSTEPGQFVDIKIIADPFSTVFMLVGDERNRLLGSENDIFTYQVVDEVKSVSYDPDLNSNIYSKEESKHDIISNEYFGPSISESTGLIILTDGLVYNRSYADGLLILQGLPTACPIFQPTSVPTSYPNSVQRKLPFSISTSF